MDIMENELVNVAMQIILHAGDARLRVEDALAQAKQFHFDEAKQDTLMTIMSELNLAKELIAFFEIMNKKIEEK